MALGLKTALGDIALTSAARGAGTFTSDQLSLAGAAADVLVLVHVTAASGTSPTLNVALEQSSDGVTWSAVTGSGIAQLIAAGNAIATASPSAQFVRVTSTVAGTTPSFTYSVSVMLFAE